MKPVRRRHPHPEIPLVSTADVAFLLLIFFLSTAIFTAERGIVLGLPAPEESALFVPSGRIAGVRVRAAGDILLDGNSVSRGGLREALAARIRAVPGLIVTLSIDQEAPYATLVETLDQVKLSGARQISLQMEAGS